MTTSLIQASELEIENENFAIIDARFNSAEPDKAEQDYLEAHIPGAVYAHLDRDLSAPVSGSNGRHPMPSVEHMVDRFSAWGIDDEVEVVVYDDDYGQFAARLWWMLHYLGHDRVAVLDGGLAAFDGELRGGREERARRTFQPRVQTAMSIDVDALAPHLGDYRLIDARASERFRGETEPLDPVAGHIPGARNLPSAENLDSNGRFLSRNELKRRFAEVVEGGADGVVSYCGSGVTACHNLLAMDIAGIRGARLYPGSWSEWCADTSRPVSKD